MRTTICSSNPMEVYSEIARIVKLEFERKEALKARIARNAEAYWKMQMLCKFGGLPEKFLISPIVDKNYQPMFPEKAKPWITGEES